MTLTAIILTHNEEHFISACLESLRPVTTDVIVIDSHSTDRTREVARSLGGRVNVRNWEGFASARNAALEIASASEWVLFIDADERVPASLAGEIFDCIATAPSNVDGYWIPRRNVICGRIMRGGGWWPDFQLRLLRPNRCIYQENREVHEFATCAGTTLALNSPLVHLNYRTWHEFVGKQLSYANLAANADKDVRARSIVGTPARTFWRHAIDQRGYLDGRAGLTAAAVLGASDAYSVWSALRSGR